MEESETPQQNDESINVEERRLDSATINEYAANTKLITFMRKKLKRISVVGAAKLIKCILEGRMDFSYKDINNISSFKRYNSGKLDERGHFDKAFIESLKLELVGFIYKIDSQVIMYNDEKDDKKPLLEKLSNDENCYLVNKNTTYETVRKIVCDEKGEADFTYNFEKKDMEPNTPNNDSSLQHVKIQILSSYIKFNYPLEYIYVCPQCSARTRKRAYTVASSNCRINCDGIYVYDDANDEQKRKVCKMSMIPDSEVSITKDAFYYDISYEDEKLNKHCAGSFSFKQYEPGFYDCVLFRVNNPKKTELFQIVDVKPIPSNIFKVPEKKEGTNYVYTLIEAFDKFILEQTGMNIYGLYPCKVALTIQTIANLLGERLIYNTQIAGDASTGKSTVLKYYSFFLNNQLNLTTNGLSISVPALRGTRVTISLMGKEQKIVTTGYLGSYRSIHIDEAGENKELVKNLKTFLLEDNYSYDKAGASGIFNRRTAHINISENLDNNHVGQYRGAIRKTYKDENLKISDLEKEPWDENWDLHLPIFRYDNPYLRKVIKDKRIEYKLKQQFWIDGYDYALHERFPFYFYLVNEKDNGVLSQIIKENIKRSTISENLELMRVLRSDDIINLFKSMNEFKESSDDEVEAFNKVDKILHNYGMSVDARMKNFFYSVIKLSRILNKRKEVDETDYDLLRWMIEKTNCKLDVTDTADYKIIGPPDVKKEEEIDKKIDDETKELDGSFGLPGDEFQ